MAEPQKAVVRCSFCGKDSDEADVMYAAVMPDVYICDGCVDFAGASLAEWRAKHRDAGTVEYESWL